MWGVRIFVAFYVVAVALLAPALLFAADDPTLQSNQTAPSQSTPSAPPSPGGATAAASSDPTGAGTTPAPISTTPPVAAAEPPRREPPRGRARTATSGAVAQAAATDTIADFSFSPKTITITAGDTVTWHNTGPTGHSATSDTGVFNTGVLQAGSDGSHTFDTPGTYAFHCSPHPYMKGTVRVLAKGGGSDGASANGSNSSDTSSGAGGGGSSSSSSSGGGSSNGSSGSRLAATGLDVALLALLGIGLLCCGTGLRLRLAARDYSPSSER
jgi:plastocyanin